MKYQVIISALAAMAMAHYSEKPEPSAPCSDAAVASAAPVYAASSWPAPAPPKASPPVHDTKPESDAEDDECPCKKKAKPSSWTTYAAHPTGSAVPAVPYHAPEAPKGNGSYVPSSPSNYTTPTNTYVPAQQTTNAAVQHGPALAGVFGLAAALALL